jgi:hypothetical protein
MQFIANCLSFVQIALELVLLAFLFLYGSFRKYPLLSVYCCVLLLTSAVELSVYQTKGYTSVEYRYVFWTDEVVTDALLFLIVIALIYRATEGTNFRRPAERLLSGVVILALLLPFVVFPRPYYSSHWFNGASQFLNFAAAVMNLLLWTALLATPKRDLQLMTVSTGLGISVTGAAISYGLLSAIHKPELREFLRLCYVLFHMLCLPVWCWAFRPGATNKPSAREEVASR